MAIVIFKEIPSGLAWGPHGLASPLVCPLCEDRGAGTGTLTGNQEVLVQTPPLSLSSCVTLRQSLSLFGPRFSHLYNGDSSGPDFTSACEALML